MRKNSHGKFFDDLCRSVEDRFRQETIVQEDSPVMDFLATEFPRGEIRFLEVGAGLGRFLEALKRTGMKLDVTALEINRDLARKLEKNGIKTANKSILDNSLRSGSFNVVHCAHVLEHFGYPDITYVLDELFRLVKKGGYIIIRGPYFHPGFYYDIDHIRPYPPKTILQYFSNEQQQKVGAFRVRMLKSWDRQDSFRLSHYFLINNILLKMLDVAIKLSWLYVGWPRGPVNGYVAVFQKVNEYS